MQDLAQDARFAAEFHADVDVEKIAGVYAEAYLNTLKEQSANNPDFIDEAVAEFTSFVELLKTQSKFANVLASAMVSIEEKNVLLDKTIAKNVSPLFQSFLNVLAKRNRLDILIPIFVQFQAMLDQWHQRIPVTVKTATEIDSQLLVSLSEKLRVVLGGEPVIRSVVDSEMIGGLVVRVGDTIYDASVLTQLKNIRQQMIDRSSHEIQSRQSQLASAEN